MPDFEDDRPPGEDKTVRRESTQKESDTDPPRDGDPVHETVGEQEFTEFELATPEGIVRESTPAEFSADGDQRPGSRRNETTEPPETIGRYRIERRLGKGGYGSVFLAYDDELRRYVTIKIPHPHRIRDQEDIDRFLAEARTLAKLEHPNVVPVHDLGRTPEGLCYIVSRYIDGSDLHHRIRSSPLTLGEAVELVATIAEALHYVHNQGVVHRDIKPNNILLDKRGVAYVADFGLALLENDAVRTGSVAGTPAYMSPEQARGENHLVEGTSDIFSLGIVLYKLVTGKHPFAGDNSLAILRAIQTRDARPPREYNRDIPSELERICLKSLSKRACDRHNTALDLAGDLRHFLAQGEGLQLVSGVSQIEGASVSHITRSSRQFFGIVPKGLRSFGSQDADSFLGLLPGPYDRDGVPESVLFWKSRIEERDPEHTFRVGLIYGPSGCGKSSFVKAGLMPTLDQSVISFVVEAAPGATENRLLSQLRRNCPYLDTKLGLPESIATLRRGKVVGEGSKVVFVIDQFEQWLYSAEEPEHSELANALRQCDGEHVQCILLIRDDFWLAFSRFMESLEIQLLQNRNMALIDLFDQRHASRVLAEFGRAFHRLPEHKSDFTRDQKSFINQAIEGLSENGKVTPVRISLFAEMIKDKPWATATLRKIGGASGVGVMFLDESFVVDGAPADYRLHTRAAYATLAELLPAPGANLKGHMRSHAELLTASGYSEQPKQFEALVRILDSELHLITRTDPEGRGEFSASQSGSLSSNLHESVYYQLAHDYLVPSIREWQVEMQRSTRRGRAEIRLAQRAEIWNTRPDKRHLPTWSEWVSILSLTVRKRWDEPQRRMMRAATRAHTASTAITIAILLLLLGGAYWVRSQFRARSLTDQLATASVDQVGGLLDQLERDHLWAETALRELQAAVEPESNQYLYATLALLRSDPSELENVKNVALQYDPDTLLLLRDELAPFGKELIGELWDQVQDESTEETVSSSGRISDPRFNAALLLANLDPPKQATGSSKLRWEASSEEIAKKLVDAANVDRSYYPSLVQLIQPADDLLADQLGAVMIGRGSSEVRRSASQRLLEDLLRDDPITLTDQLLDADISQITSSLQLLDTHRKEVRPLLESVVREKLDIRDPDWKQDAKRKATAAALLLRHGVSNDDVWAVFRPDRNPPVKLEDLSEEFVQKEVERLLSGSEANVLEELKADNNQQKFASLYQELTYGRTRIPNARTRLVQRVLPFMMDAKMLAHRLLIESDVEIRCGLIHGLGEFESQDVGDELRGRVLDLVKGWYTSAREAVLHANAHWFLKRWAPEWLDSQTPDPVVLPSRNWYINSEGHTMIRIPKHSPTAEYGLEVAMTEVTLGQLQRWEEDTKREKKEWYATSKQCAVGSISYLDAIAYCNWLSRAEGLGDEDLCYPDHNDDELDATLVQIYPDYANRRGYRLPFAREWFFMCKAGAITDYAFGSCYYPGVLSETERLSDGYSPSRPTGGNEPWVYGVGRPNDFGIFDTYVNVREWANDLNPKDTSRFQVCGFDYRYHWGMAGVTPRYVGWSKPSANSGFYGFRVVRSRPTE